MSTATAADSGRDYRILSVIGIGHFMSHFFYMALPPLFVPMRESFGVSYAELGTVLALMYAVSAAVQVPIGFLVDRIGARSVLVAGLVIVSVAIGLIGLAPNFATVVVLSLLAGLGNAVFHPTDYAILNASISASRMGRAFSIHTFAGHLGTAAAPTAMIIMTQLMDWRLAMVGAGVMGLVALAVILTQLAAMRDEIDARPATPADKGDRPAAGEVGRGLKLLLSRPMLMFFLFFTVLAMTQGGLQAFAATAFVTLHGMPLETANLALSVYLFASAAGVLLGGELADRLGRHDVVAGTVFVMTAVVAVAFALIHPPALLLVLLMGAIGLGQGATRPARDMMLRAAAPKGATGRVFGFVTAGIALGAALAPIPLGYLLDIGRPDWVFYLIALFMVVALLSMWGQTPTSATTRPGQARPMPNR